jgi:tight adherence protein C
MTDQTTLIICLFASVAMLVWWITSLLLHDDFERLRDRLRSDDADAHQQSNTAAGISDTLKRVGHVAASPFMPKTREAQSSLRHKLATAGIYSPAAIRLIIGCKVLFLAAGIVAGYVLGLTLANVWAGLSFGGLIGYLLPAIWLRLQVKQQQKALQRGLPDALDLMVVCVEAGLTVDAAMQRVGQEITIAHPRLSRELEITHMETRVGLSRSDALRNLGRRTESIAIQSLATMLIQAERFGTSIAAALRIHAETLRIQRQHAAEEQAAKASVKLTFPVVLFIFPAVLIVLAGPAAIGLFKDFVFAE